jgi:VWFA-related protein
MRILCIIALQLICLTAISAQDKQNKNSAAPAASIGIVIDCSGSQRLQLDKTINAIKQIAEAMRPGDEAFLVRFIDSSKITITQDFTSNKSELQDAADELFIEGGQTAVLDAVDFAARHFSENPSKEGNRSRVLILFADGDDRKSLAKMDETLALLKQEKIRVFTIGLSDLNVSAKLLEKFPKDTGGKAFVPRSTAEISNAVVEITAAIRGEQPAKK